MGVEYVCELVGVGVEVFGMLLFEFVDVLIEWECISFECFCDVIVFLIEVVVECVL